MNSSIPESNQSLMVSHREQIRCKWGFIFGSNLVSL